MKKRLEQNRTAQFIKNVRFLTKGRTGEFETECGVCKGYLARADSKAAYGMNIETALIMAEKLGYTVEDLSKSDVIKKQQIAEIDERIAELSAQRDRIALAD